MANLERLIGWWPWRRAATPSEELGKDGPLTAMVIVAHPDDAEFSCAGTVAKWCEQGWTVYYVLATSGDKGTHDPALTPQELAALREQEQREACRVLGVKEVIFLAYQDGFLRADDEFRGQIVRLLRRYRPDVVLTWDGFRPGFNHSDHRAVGIAVRDAVYPAVRDHLYYPQDKDDGLEAHRVNEMLLIGSEDRDYDVDISGQMEKKLEAVLCHRSQLGDRSPEEVRRAWQQRMGAPRNGRLVESFKWVRIRRPPRPQQQPAESAAAQAPASPLPAGQAGATGQAQQ
jgi:LmbE family N-acetylglucosaminyl deacetylase